MDFIAIDFETANEKRHSPCSLGITIVKNNKIIEEKYWLIRPSEMRFTPMNIMIHGIRETDVENEKEFNELWEELFPYFDNTLIVAHNASFDISVLRKTLDLYNIPYPNFNYCCTMIMSRNFFPNLKNAKLNTVSNYLGYEFNHHHASADATACANILLEIRKILKVTTIEELTNLVGVKIGNVSNSSYTSAGKLGKPTAPMKIIAPLDLPLPKSISIINEPTTTKTDYFKDKLFVFTGALPTLTRGEAMQLTRKFGALTGSSVTKKTDVLVVGGKNLKALKPHEMSTKRRRAMDLISKGQKIEILTGEEFLKLLMPKGK